MNHPKLIQKPVDAHLRNFCSNLRMGNKVSTARKLQQGVKKTEESFVRSQINQLPSEKLKDKFRNPQIHHQEPQSTSQTEAIKSTASQQHHEGKDGFDPQMNAQESKDFIDTISRLGKVIESKTLTVKLDSNSIRLLKNRKELEKKDAFTSQQLNSLLSDLNDRRYTTEQVKKDYDLDDEWIEILSRFKVADTYKAFKTFNKDEIGHDGIKNEKTFDEINNDIEVVQSDDISNKQTLKDRLSLDK